MRSWVGASPAGRASTRPAARRATSTTSASRACSTVARSAPPSRAARSRPSTSTSTARASPLVDHRDVPGPQRRRAHRGRPALPRRARGAPRRGAGPAPRPRGPRHAARGRGAPRVPPGHARPRPRTLDAGLQGDHDREGRPRARVCRGRPRGRGRVPHRPPGARLHRAERRDRGAGRGRGDGLRLAPVPVLRAQGPGGPPRPSPREGARRPDGDRRGLRRQGGLPFDHRRARGAPGGEVGAAGEARVRPPRGHGRDHQAPPLDRPPPHRREARRPDHRDGDRRPPRRRRLLHAEPGRALARVPSRDRPLPLRQRPRPRASRDDEHAALWRLPGLRRAADGVRGRSAPGSRGRGPGQGPRGHSREERPRPGRHHGYRPGAGRGRDRARGAARGGHALRLPPQAPGLAGHESRDRPLAVLPRRGLHRLRRGDAGLAGRARARPGRRAHPRRQHRDGPGRAHDARADRGRDHGPAARARPRGDARHRERARQRPDRRLSHLHGRGGPAQGVRGGARGEARPASRLRPT